VASRRPVTLEFIAGAIGTPRGLGVVMKRPDLLKPGDRFHVEIEGLGALDDEVVQEP